MFRTPRILGFLKTKIFSNDIRRCQRSDFPFKGTEIIRSRGFSSCAVPQHGKSNYEKMVDRKIYLTKPYPRSANARISGVGVTDGGKNVEIVWNDGVTSRYRYHSLWLRHGCHCQSCRLTTNQPVVNFQHVDMDLTVLRAEKEGEELLRVTWSDDASHTGLFPLPFLKHRDYSAVAHREKESQREVVFQHKDAIPEMSYDSIMNTETGLYRWLRALSDYGICLIKNVPTNSKEVIKVAERISVVYESDTYGKIFDVRDVPDPDSSAFTTIGLDLHMGSQMYESPPGIQLFHCLRFDKEVTGGETIYMDMFYVLERFRETHPREFKDMVRIPATWESIFYTGSQHRVYQQPHISLNREGKIAGVRWHPGYTGVLQTSEDDIEPYYNAYKKLETMVATFPLNHTIRLQEGDLISNNNRRWLHGRTAFRRNGGVRHLQGCYVQIDEFLSKVQLYSNTIGDGKLSTRLGNNSWE